MLPEGLNALLGKTAPPSGKTPPPTAPPTLDDWLRVNGLRRAEVARWLARLPRPEAARPAAPTGGGGVPAAPEAAWTLCADRLHAAFPRLGAAIDRVASGTPRALAPDPAKHPSPFTYDLGRGALPFVSLHYRGRAGDLLAMAHEFGHALQIVASADTGTDRMPPLARECCAFLAERAILGTGPVTSPALRAAHDADDRIYYGADRSALEVALATGAGPYRYAWNYPLARHIAARLFDGGAAVARTEAFRRGRGGCAFLMGTRDGPCDGPRDGGLVA